MTHHRHLASAIVTLSSLAATANIKASIAFQHQGSSDFSYTSGQYGDEILLAGSDRIISAFEFEYYANFNRNAGLTFRIYAQDGTVIDGQRAPGTLLYSTSLDVFEGGRVAGIRFDYNPANLLPDRFTYTVDFETLAPGEQAGLIVPGGIPSVGYSSNDFWEKTGPGDNDWTLRNFGSDHTANFTATVRTAPQPSTLRMSVASDGSLQLEWDGSSALEGAPTPDGPWTPVLKASSPFRISTAYTPSAFFRTVVPNPSPNDPTPAPTSMALSVQQDGTLQIQWDGDPVVEGSQTPDGPWIRVSFGSGSLQITPSITDLRFFRTVSP